MIYTSTQHYRFGAAALTFTSPTLADVGCQLTNVTLTNSTPQGAKVYTFCSASPGLFIEDVDPAWTLEATFRQDWTATASFSRFLETNDLATVGFSLNIDAGITKRDRTYTGTCVIMAASDGGDAHTAQEGKVSLQIVGKPTLVYNADS